jgi:hypothetical protein
MTTSGKLRRLLLVATLVGVALVPSAATGQRPAYTNPVSQTFADTFADPAVIKG